MKQVETNANIKTNHDDGNAAGNSNPASGYLQNLDNPYGKTIRINPLEDTANGKAFSVPSSNPFVGQAGAAEEIYALGFRDQQTFSFGQDRNGANVLVTIDIGASQREEISLVRPGGNYGWERFEGTVDLNPGVALALGTHHSPPVAEYVHSAATGGFAIIGGLRVSDPNFLDQVVFSDLSNGKLFFVDYDALLQAEIDGDQAQIFEINNFTKDGTIVMELGVGISSNDINQLTFEDVYGAPRGDARFGTDEAGNVYIVSKQSGEIFRTGWFAVAAVPEPSSFALYKCSGDP